MGCQPCDFAYDHFNLPPGFVWVYMGSSQSHKIYNHDLEVMGSNPGWVQLEVRSISVKVILEPKISLDSDVGDDLTKFNEWLVDYINVI